MQNGRISSDIDTVADGEVLRGMEAVGRFLGLSSRRVGELAKDRGLPLHQLGLHKVATKRQLLAWLEAQPLSAGHSG